MAMNVSQAANFLGVSEQTVKRWLRQGVIPVHYQKGTPRFLPDELLSWADYCKLGRGSAMGKDQPTTPIELLIDALDRGGVHYDVPAAPVEGLLSDVLSRLPLPEQADRKALHQLLVQREAIISTGVGRGVAVPHPKDAADAALDQAYLGCFFLAQEVDYKALDGQPVFCLFVLLAPNAAIHLKILSELAKRVKNPTFIDALRTKPEPEALRGLFLEQV